MLLRTLTLAALLVALLSTSTATQNASSIVAGASKAMGVDSLNSITYSGTARNGAFGQSKAIGEPMPKPHRENQGSQHHPHRCVSCHELPCRYLKIARSASNCEGSVSPSFIGVTDT